MKINPLIFRAYDIRGIYKKDIDEDLFFKIGFVLGKKGKKFLVGRDIRSSGNSLAKGIISGLQKKGAKVFYGERLSFGQCLFSGLKLNVSKTIFITASHLPPQWNGLKIFYGKGLPISESDIQKIKKDVLKLKREYKKEKIKVQKVNLKEEYLRFFLDKFSHIKGNHLKVVLDCGNGSMSLSAPKIFRKLGFDIVELFCRPASDFPNRDSEPTFEATEKLRKAVLKEKADFGVAFDGDGDRVVIIDNKGRYLKGDIVGLVIAKDILKNSKNRKIVASIPCTMALERELKEADIIRIPVGHTFLTLMSKKEKAVMGMEESSHFCFPQYFWFDDALIPPLKIAEILVKEKKKLSQLIEENRLYPFAKLRFQCPDEKKFKVMKSLEDEFRKRYKKVDTLDGIKVYFPYGWILIRASNTSPMIKVYIEGENKKRIGEIEKRFSKELKKKIKE